MKFLQRLKAFVEHPATQLVTGLALVVSGGWEIVLDFVSTERSVQLGVHHGVVIFGLIQVLGALPELVEGLDRAFHAVDKRRES